MQKLILVYNQNSSHYGDVSEQVLAPARQLKGWMVGKYVIKPTNFDDNVQNLAKLINDGDLVVAAGGDGTAAMTVNGILQSGKRVTLGVLGFGNFNDIAGMLGERDLVGIVEGFMRGEVREAYPLEILVDDKRWRYALSYFTMGMFAKSTGVFDNPKVRQKLQSGKKSRAYSIWQLMKWYFGKGKRSRLPAGKVNGEEWPMRTSDYMAENGRTMAGMMQGGEWFLEQDNFLSSVQRLGSLCRLGKFMLVSMRKQVPGVVSERDVLEFVEPSMIELHAEGEYESREGVRKIEVKKANKTLRVVMAGLEDRGGLISK